jgi:bacillithiol synthase
LNKILNTPLYNSLYYDFLKGDKRILKYLPDFKNVSWQEQTESIANQSMVYSSVKEILIKDNSDINSTKGKKNLELLKNENTAFIITGQQLGLFASPLYTIYKIITTIKLANQLNSQNLEFIYVPLFWLESEDHDFEEVNHFGIWNKKFEPQKLLYGGESRGKVSIKHYSFEHQIEELVEQLNDELIPTEFSNELFNKIRQWFKTGESWLTASREILKDIFYETGLLFFKPGYPQIKKASAPFFQNIIENSTELNTQFRNVSGELEKSGYSNQVTVVDGKTFLFTENDSLQREHIYFENNEFFTKESGIKLSKSELLEIVNKSSEKISTSVVSRPLLQSWLLPTAAYIAGPGEIAYWAQIGGMFDQMKLMMPVVYPRISATILEPKIQRFINKYEPDVKNLPKKSDEFIKTVLSKRDDTTFQISKEKIKTELENIRLKIIATDPTLENTFQKTVEKMIGQIDLLENKTLKAKQQIDQTLVSQLQQIHSAFYPEGYPQERYLTFVYFLNKFGPEIFTKIFNAINLDQTEHQIIEI